MKVSAESRNWPKLDSSCRKGEFLLKGAYFCIKMSNSANFFWLHFRLKLKVLAERAIFLQKEVVSVLTVFLPKLPKGFLLKPKLWPFRLISRKGSVGWV